MGALLMPSNIEIKARSGHFDDQKAIAAQLSAGESEIIHQEDTFFNIPQGRLKLRKLSQSRGELIYYERDDSTGPKRSHYHLTHTEDPDSLKTTLGKALGILGVVRKCRTLYLVGQTRIHLDEVEGLGEFIELEVVMREDQNTEEGSIIVQDLMRRLHIAEEDLLQGAYMDLLLKMNESPSPMLTNSKT